MSASDAVACESPGDTIEIAAGVWQETVAVWHHLTLEGVGGAEATIIDKNGASTPVLQLRAPGVGSIVRGVTITGGAAIWGAGEAVYVFRALNRWCRPPLVEQIRPHGLPGWCSRAADASAWEQC